MVSDKDLSILNSSIYLKVIVYWKFSESGKHKFSGNFFPSPLFPVDFLIKKNKTANIIYKGLKSS